MCNNLFKDRRILYIVLVCIIASILSLSIVYAALSTILDINGRAEVSAASWDIHLDNVVLNNRSATPTAPTITDSKTATFSTTLTKPGDFYEFTIDVVNNGSIDAMIDSVIKIPNLTEAQAKYLDYIIEYQNGEAVTTKQLVSKNSYVRLKIKVEFRKDITASDLPSQAETLNLSFEVNYIQSDESGTSVKDDGVLKTKLDIISGNLETVGSEVAIGDEHFYIISSDSTSVTMLTKYNLYVGGSYEGSWTPYGEEATGLQNSTMLGRPLDSSYPRRGTSRFATSVYWGSVSEGTYIYDNNSTLYNYVEYYRKYLESIGAVVDEARLIKLEELESLGCTDYNCYDKMEWIYSTSYWTGFGNDDNIYGLYTYGGLDLVDYSYNSGLGLRPVIKVIV